MLCMMHSWGGTHTLAAGWRVFNAAATAIARVPDKEPRPIILLIGRGWRACCAQVLLEDDAFDELIVQRGCSVSIRPRRIAVDAGLPLPV